MGTALTVSVLNYSKCKKSGSQWQSELLIFWMVMVLFLTMDYFKVNILKASRIFTTNQTNMWREKPKIVLFNPNHSIVVLVNIILRPW